MASPPPDRFSWLATWALRLLGALLAYSGLEHLTTLEQLTQHYERVGFAGVTPLSIGILQISVGTFLQFRPTRRLASAGLIAVLGIATLSQFLHPPLTARIAVPLGLIVWAALPWAVLRRSAGRHRAPGA